MGDTWKVNEQADLELRPALGLLHALEGEVRPSSPSSTRAAPNPGAGGRPGRLAFAGDEYGAASYGADYPEKPYKKAFAPRLGVTYAFNPKTLVRAGWGIFYDRAFYPGWGGGISQDGFSSNAAFSSSLGGLEPAFYLQQGFPQNFTQPPFIQSDFLNGQVALFPAARRQRAAALATVEPHPGPRDRQGLHGGGRLRGQPRPRTCPPPTSR